VTEHLGDVQTTAQMAIITGDPDRVPALAEAIGPGPYPETRQRGFVCSEVPNAQDPASSMLIVSTGIGGPSTALIVDELWHLGITQVVRVGTCGAMQRHVRPGNVVISSGAVRDEGTSRQYVPAQVPAVPDPLLLVGLVRMAEDMGIPFHVGLTHSKDAFSTERPFGMPLSDEWSARWNMLRALGILATEMESAALFAVGLVRKIRTGSLLVPVDGQLGADRKREALQGAARLAAATMITTREPHRGAR